MGTNFYWHDRPCEHCGRYERIHVGKRSAGWSFGFRGYRHDLLNAAEPDWGYRHESPFGFPVLSRADWCRVFTERRGVLVDEYSRMVDDPLTWLAELPAPDEKQRAWGDSETWHDWCRPTERDWRDGDGFRFYDGEFS